MDVDESADTDWALVAELIDTSYRQVALKRQIAALDARPVVETTAPTDPRASLD
jgi:hypothetical protein